MSIAHPSEIEEIEAQLALEPNSRFLREQLLKACGGDDSLSSRPSRIETILWFIENDPGHIYCRTPLTAVIPGTDSVGYQTVRDAWFKRIDQTPANPNVLRGAAFLIAKESNSTAQDLLRRAAALSPNDASVPIDHGLIADSAFERFEHFSRARDLGSTHQNLPVLLAQAAAEAGLPEATSLAQALLDAARADEDTIGDAIHWMESGHDLWQKARAARESDAEARALTSAIARRSYYKHYGHTLLGVLAQKRGDLAGAIAHLHASRDIQHDFRLDAYGPSPELIGALCRQGEFESAEAFLRAWLVFSDNERAKAWLADVERKEIPSDDDPA